LTAEKYCETGVDFFCQYLTGCCTSQERDYEPMSMLFPVTMDDCANPPASGVYTYCVDIARQSVSDGKIILDGASWSGCTETLTQLVSGCPNLGTFWELYQVAWHDSCRDMVIGLVDQGGTCSEGGYECREGLYCAQDLCMPMASPGGECSSDEQCGSGYTCVGDPTRFCSPTAQGGESCEREQNCGTGLYCDREARLCMPLLGAGSACTIIDIPGFYCEGMCMIETMPEGECQDFCNGA
jgi:hypothetical protein